MNFGGTVRFCARDAKELQILNRTIKIDLQNDEMTWDADTKLVEYALETTKFFGARVVDSPPVRITRISRQRRSTLYRSLVMKLAYVAQDRLDIAEAVKCLTRHVKEKSHGADKCQNSRG